MRKVYRVIMEDKENAYKEFIPAENTKEIKECWGGNGEFVSIKDVTNEYPINIGSVIKALESYGFSKPEVDIISRTLQNDLENTI